RREVKAKARLGDSALHAGVRHGLGMRNQLLLQLVQTTLRSRIPLLAEALMVGSVGLCCLSSSRGAPAEASKLPPAATRQVDFAKDVRPLLEKTCYECHGPEKQKAGLRLDQKAAALKGGDTGPVIVAGKSAESLLIQVVTGTKEDISRMPKKRDPLSDEQIG